MEAQLTFLVNYGVLGIIAYVFFKGYFDDKKNQREMHDKQIQHEKEMAVILNKSTETISTTQSVIKESVDLSKDAKSMHQDMDEKIQRIFDEMATAQNQYELIKAVNELRQAWEEMTK